MNIGTPDNKDLCAHAESERIASFVRKGFSKPDILLLESVEVVIDGVRHELIRAIVPVLYYDGEWFREKRTTLTVGLEKTGNSGSDTHNEGWIAVFNGKDEDLISYSDCFKDPRSGEMIAQSRSPRQMLNRSNYLSADPFYDLANRTAKKHLKQVRTAAKLNGQDPSV